jgi:eukaryotic-like serine/threonine-protein kinase
MIGQTVGNYRIESLLGTGGMGQVYRASHVHLGRPAAVKIMHASLSGDATFRARFLQEAKAAAALEHPNIVQIYDFGEQGDHLYLVMELVSGGSVRGLSAGEPEAAPCVSLPLSLSVALQTAVGLAFAHDRGMVHRDIKPDNLLLQPASNFTPAQPSYVVKIGDFGLARLAGDGVKTSAGLLLGTPAYMSPEQVRGEALDRRSDIYSLGIVLYELTVGRRPFEANTISQAVYQHVFVPPPPPRTLVPELPPLVEEIILHCLAKQPQDRYGTAMELIADLHRALAESAWGGGLAPAQVAPGAETPPHAGDAAVTAVAATQALGAAGAPAQGIAAPEAEAIRVQVLDANDQPVQTVLLQTELLRVGRAPDNDVILNHPGVSRHHCEVRRERDHLEVRDLNSSNGTYLDGSRLAAGQPAAWEAGAEVGVGPYTLRLYAPAQADRTVSLPLPRTEPRTEVQFAAAAGDIVLLAAYHSLTVDPGTTLLVATNVYSGRAYPIDLSMRLSGTAAWSTVAPTDLHLEPGSSREIAVSVSPPRSAQVHAADYTLKVQAVAQDAVVATLDLAVTVTPYHQFDSSVTPSAVKAGQPAAVHIANQGNVTDAFVIAGQDDSGRLVFDPAEAQSEVAAGANRTEAFTPRARRRRLLGRGNVCPILIHVRPAQGASQTHRLAVTMPALVPYWLLFVLLFLVLCLAGAGFALQPPGWLAKRLGPIWPAAGVPTSVLPHEPAATVPTPAMPPALVPAPVPTVIEQRTAVATVPTEVAGVAPTEPPAPTATQPPPPAPAMACVVTNPTLNVRRGPGIVYDPPIATLEMGAAVQPLAYTASGFPSGAWLLVEVDGSGVTGWISRQFADCGTLDVTRLPGGEIPATPTPKPAPVPLPVPFVPIPTASGPYTFEADRTHIKQGECSYLRWNVEGVREVYFNNEGVAGVALQWVCPTTDTVYTLRVVRPDGSQVQQTIAIAVSPQSAAYTANVAADRQNVRPGECTTLRWNVQSVREVFVNGMGVGGIGTMYVCPQGTTTYRWRIVLVDRSETSREVTVAVSP